MDRPQLYQKSNLDSSILPDEEQSQVFTSFDQLREDITLAYERNKSWHNRLRHWALPTTGLPGVQGRYVWGGVGRGKTWIMDTFYESLVTDRKLRLHFYQFMQLVHEELKALGGLSDPLPLVAKNLAKEVDVICLDEFFVSDISDAMLLYGLLKGLFDQHVVIIMTTNIEPDELYKNGLQRERFIPAIELIKQRTQLIRMQGTTDFRQLNNGEMLAYVYPSNNENRRYLEEMFGDSEEVGPSIQTIEINHRKIPYVKLNAQSVWFDFHVICGEGRSSLDYIEIARLYERIFISDVPQLNEESDDKARRFVSLVDTLYDNQLAVYISAEYPPHEVYTGKRFRFEFDRTISRLVELASKN